jgi:hypothetical protein
MRLLTDTIALFFTDVCFSLVYILSKRKLFFFSFSFTCIYYFYFIYYLLFLFYFSSNVVFVVYILLFDPFP